MLLFLLVAHASPVTFTRLAPTVWMHTSEQAVEGWGLVPSNGLVVVREGTSILVDTAWDDAQTDEVLDWARDVLGHPVQAAVFTHAHQDKMGGVGALQARGLSTWAAPLSNQLAPTRDLVAAQHDLTFDGAGNAELPAALQGIEVYAPGPGHTLDNLVVQVDGVLFGGCLVRPGDADSLGNTADGSIPAWAGSVQRVAERFAEAGIVVPSHGIPGDRTLLDHTRALALAAAPAPDWTPLRTAMEAVPRLVDVRVEQHGEVQFEHRLRPGVTRGPAASPDPALHDIRSAGKSITALAVGIAVDEGHLELDTPVWPLLGASLPPDDPRNTITVGDLLAMGSGLDCDDGRKTPGREARMYRRRSWRAFALDIPLTPTDTRGSFAYCTAGVFLLGQAVQEATGVRFDAWVQTRLFDPLDIHGVIWRHSPSGEVQAGGQLAITPEDLAKLGRLVLNRGVWRGTPVLSRSWVHTMLQPRPIGPGMQYGSLWWFRGFRTPEGPTGAAFMSGNGGNLVVLLPDYDAVIVVQSANYNRPDAHQRSFELVEAALAQLERSPTPR